MSKLELEVKILDIDKNEFIKKIQSLGAEFKEEIKQTLYTYDLATIYGRYIDILAQLNKPESNIKYETALSKLKLLFFEVDNLLNNNDKEELYNIIGYNNLTSLCNNDNILKYLNDERLINYINRFYNNDKKWIRLRQSNNKTTLAVKHILADSNSSLQQMLKTEMEVPSIEEANKLLEALGFSYKSYQEKERITYILDDYEINIDSHLCRN